jgi:hypothetical protein
MGPIWATYDLTVEALQGNITMENINKNKKVCIVPTPRIALPLADQTSDH